MAAIHQENITLSNADLIELVNLVSIKCNEDNNEAKRFRDVFFKFFNCYEQLKNYKCTSNDEKKAIKNILEKRPVANRQNVDDMSINKQKFYMKNVYYPLSTQIWWLSTNSYRFFIKDGDYTNKFVDDIKSILNDMYNSYPKEYALKNILNEKKNKPVYTSNNDEYPPLTSSINKSSNKSSKSDVNKKWGANIVNSSNTINTSNSVNSSNTINCSKDKTVNPDVQVLKVVQTDNTNKEINPTTDVNTNINNQTPQPITVNQIINSVHADDNSEQYNQDGQNNQNEDYDNGYPEDNSNIGSPYRIVQLISCGPHQPPIPVLGSCYNDGSHQPVVHGPYYITDLEIRQGIYYF